MGREQEILGIFPDYLRKMWNKAANRMEDLQEIRLRCNLPVILLIKHREFFLSDTGEITSHLEDAHRTIATELEHIINHVCNYSIYAYEDEMKQGYLTIPGGHRIGIAGQVVLEHNEVKSMKNISCLNIRISHQIKEVSTNLLSKLYSYGDFLNTIIISPPGCGKTTMLRDIIRQVSNGNSYAKGKTVGLVDERSEIAGSYMGIAQNDVGIRTDVLDGCPKAIGMMMLIRSMSPQIIAVDELGNKEDIIALQQAICSGSKLVVTIHGYSILDIQKKMFLRELLDLQIFERFIILEKVNNRCNVQAVYNQDYVKC